MSSLLGAFDLFWFENNTTRPRVDVLRTAVWQSAGVVFVICFCVKNTNRLLNEHEGRSGSTARASSVSKLFIIWHSVSDSKIRFRWLAPKGVPPWHIHDDSSNSDQSKLKVILETVVVNAYDVITLSLSFCRGSRVPCRGSKVPARVPFLFIFFFWKIKMCCCCWIKIVRGHSNSFKAKNLFGRSSSY